MRFEVPPTASSWAEVFNTSRGTMKLSIYTAVSRKIKEISSFRIFPQFVSFLLSLKDYCKQESATLKCEES